MEGLQAVVCSVEAVVGKMEGEKLEGLHKATEELDKRAAKAQHQIDHLFLELAQHKHGLEDLMQAVRKDACQPITDAFNACRVLVRVVRNAEGSGGVGGGGMVGEEAEEHVGFALVVGEAVVTVKGRGRGDGEGRGGGRRRVVLLEFVVQGGRNALDRWKAACRLHIEVGCGEWDALPGVQPHPLPSLNAPRNYHAAAVVSPSNHVFVVGGQGSDGQFLNSVERLESGNNAWQKTGMVVPTARRSCGACAVDNTVIVVGGFNNGNSLNVVEAVDTATGACTRLSPLPQRVTGCGVVSVQGKVVVTGGFGDSSDLNVVWVLDVGNDASLQRRQQPLQWASLPSMAHVRSWHGAAAGGGCVFVCGGFKSIFALNSCEMLRVVGEERQGGWEALPPLPKRLDCVGCCYGGGNVFVAGGRPGSRRLVLALGVKERKWTQVGELATGRFGCAAVCVGRRVMVLGGSNGDILDSCEVFEF